MQEVSFAARFRVAYREASASGGLADAAATRRLDTLRLDSEFLARGGRWRWWYMHSYYHNLTAAIQYGRRLGISIDTVEDDLGSCTPRPHTKAQTVKLQKGVQRAARTSLCQVLRVDPEQRLRKKLERWKLPLFPRIRAMSSKGHEAPSQPGPPEGFDRCSPHLVQRVVHSEAVPGQG